MFLGINYGGLHDSSVALVDDLGQVRFAASEERFSRIKKDGRFPASALSHIALDEVTRLGIPYLAQRERPDAPDPFFKDVLLDFDCGLSDQSCFPAAWHERIAQVGKPVHHVDHHEAHAVAGFHLSGFENALVITCDGGAFNCAWNMGFYEASAHGLRPLHRASHDHYYPLCSLYSDFTAVLGYKPNVHEGKLTGLAGYAADDHVCEATVWESYCQLRQSGSWLCEFVGAMQSKHSATMVANGALVLLVRSKLSNYTDAEIAHAVQRITEKKVIELTDKLLSEQRFDQVVLAGGIFANVKLNREVKQLGFKQIFVCPAMGDEGVALGAALAARSETLSCGIQGAPARHVFWGPTLHADSSQEVSRLSVNATRMLASSSDIAQLLADGNIVVRVTGEMEFGPRALGHRSILCQPTDPTVNDWLNKKLKRTEFMPFAPAVLAERAAELFEAEDLEGAEHTAAFMTICMKCKPLFKKLCPAVVHVDGTARPQIVSAESQPDLHRILVEYEKLTGLPALINTSFNVHDEPIVTSVKDAIVAFFQSRLDYLALDGLLITADANPIWATAVNCCDNPLLQDQRALLTATSKQMGATIVELRESKSWLEQQVSNWQQEAKHCTQVVAEQASWVEELRAANVWLEQQVQNWQHEAQHSAQVISEQTSWIAELQAAKDWLSSQCDITRATAVR